MKQWKNTCLAGMFFLFITSCVKIPATKNYTEVMKLQNLIVAVPLGPEAKPIWEHPLLTATSETWCGKRTHLRLPDGNEWKNKDRFLCLPNTAKNMIVFQNLKRKDPAWKFRWNCTSDEPACVIKK